MSKVTGLGDCVQLVSSDGTLASDIGVIVEQSAHDRTLWRVVWLNCDEWTTTNGMYGDWYDTWVETGDLWAIRKK